ncbi:hypothetical protein LXL04_038826 [Taraxacum kok-saghyz]
MKMSSVNDQAAGELVEELNRVSAENKKLTEMLTVMCENYNALQNHLTDYMSKNPAPSDSTNNNSNSKKRKPEIPVNQIINTKRGISESSSSDEDSCKKPRQEQHLKAAAVRQSEPPAAASPTTDAAIQLVGLTSSSIEPLVQS